MRKKLIIIFEILLVLIVAVILLGAVAKLPWSFPLDLRLVHGAETSIPTSTALATRLAPPEQTATPTHKSATTVPMAQPVLPPPTCFTIQELPPVAFSPDLTQILVRTRSGVQVFNLKTGELDDFIQSSQNVIAASLSPDGQTLAWVLEDGNIQLVRLSDQKNVVALSGHFDSATHLQFSPAGDRLFTATHDGMVRIWDLNGKQMASIDAGGEVVGFGISKDGMKLATIPFDGPVLVWDLSSNTKIMDLAGTGGYDTSEAYFSPDGRYLAADLASGIYLWRLSDGSLVWNQVKGSMAVAFSPDGQYLAYSDIDDGNKIILAAPDTGEFIRILDKMQSPVWSLLFSPDASLLAVTDAVEIHVWRVADETLLSVGKAACP